jgi:methyl-accepting chemotaxis protein
MAFHPLSFFTERYSESTLQVRKKSRILTAIAFVFGGISLLFALLMAATGAAVVAVVFVGIVLFCAAVLAMLRSGRYHAASSAFLYGIFTAMFVAIKFDQYQDVYETYVFGTLGCFLLVVTTLIADRPRQAAVIGVLDLAAIQALYWLDAFPKDGGKVTLLAIQNLVTPSLLTGIAAGVAAYLVSMTTSLLREVEREAESAERSFDELNSAMNQAQSASQRIGEALSASVARTSSSIGLLSGQGRDISRGMDELDEALSRSGEASRKAGECQVGVKAALAAYSDQVARASAAIEQMAGAANSLASQAGSKKAAVSELVETSRTGESVLLSMSQSMALIQESAKRVADLGAIIGDVADRTNLLGMNASIEAAHAGAAGRGFAVVANEIRNLSIEAGKSARVIGDTLKEVQAAIASTAGRSGEALSSFRKITESVRGVSQMIEELLASIQELSSGSGDVVSAVEAVADLTRSTEEIVERASEGMTESLGGMDTVAEIASRVRVETSEMSERFDEMRKDSEEVKSLGGDNLGTIQALKSSLDSFSRNRGSGAPELREKVRPSRARGIAVKRSEG